MSSIDFVVMAAALAASASTGAFLGYFDESRKRRKRRDQLLVEIKEAVCATQPTWEQIIDLAEIDQIGVKDVIYVVRKLLKAVLLGKEPDLAQHRPLLESYIAKHKAAEPFEGLPNETRIHLERLREAMEGQETLLEPLTSQIKELVSVYESDKRSQRRYTVWGFFLGVGGLIFAAYTYFYPYAAK